MLDHRPRELVTQAVVHQKACRRDADLPSVAELCAGRGPDREFDIGVGRDDHRGMAAELHRRALHVRAGHRGQLLAHWRRAGEGDLADDRVGDQIGRDLGRRAEHQADRAGRHPSVDKGLQQRGGRGWRLLRRLDEEGAAAGQRRGELANHLVDRKVPRRERRHRAHRLFHHQLLGRQVARGDDAAVDAPAFVGEPLDDVGSGHDLDARFANRLALLLRQQPGDVGSALAHQPCGLAHRRRALVGRHLAPVFEAALGRRQRTVKVGDASVGDPADDLASGGIDHVDRLATGGVAPLACDQQSGVGIALCHLGPWAVHRWRRVRPGASGLDHGSVRWVAKQWRSHGAGEP